MTRASQKIAVLYIATGRYITFFGEFYKSAEKKFLKNHKKTYFVFTDNEEFDFCNEENVVRVEQQRQGWPYDSLLRYDMFLGIKNELLKYDYCYYVNANCIVLKEIGDEIFPTDEHGGLAGCLWANYFYADPDDMPYSRNEKSQAYIPKGQGKNYYMGGLNGGRVKDFLKMSEEISAMAHKDIETGELAEVFDESLLNKYFLDKNPLQIPPSYCFPAKWKIKPFCKDVKMVIEKKHHYKYGGHAYLRGETDKKISPWAYFLNKIFKLNLK